MVFASHAAHISKTTPRKALLFLRRTPVWGLCLATVLCSVSCVAPHESKNAQDVALEQGALAASGRLHDVALSQSHLERHSGPNQTKAGADVLALNEKYLAQLNAQEGNATDWMRFEAPQTPGVLQVDCKIVEGAKTAIDIQVLPKDSNLKPCTGSVFVDMQNPMEVWVKAAHGLAAPAGSYLISSKWFPVSPSIRPGIVVRLNKNMVTIDLGSEDGVKTGQRGFIRRSDASAIEFEIERVLKRSANGRIKGQVSPSDLNMSILLIAALR